MATLKVTGVDAPNVRIAVDGVEYQFEGGYLDTSDAEAERIRRQGQTLFPHLGIAIVETGEASRPATVAELRARLDELGVDVPRVARKADLEALLAEAEASTTDDGQED